MVVDIRPCCVSSCSLLSLTLRSQILEGLATIVVAALSLFVLSGCDSPEVANFLTEEERAYIIQRQSTHYFQDYKQVAFANTRSVEYDNSSVGEDTSFSKKYVWQALLDWQVIGSFFPFFLRD